MILPGKGRRFFEASLGRALSAQVSLEGIAYNPFRGVRLRGLRVTPRGEGPPLFEAASVHLDLVLRALLFRKVRIEGIKIRAPVIRIERGKKGWNVPEKLFHFPEGKEGIRIVVSRIRIRGGRLILKTGGEPLTVSRIRFQGLYTPGETFHYEFVGRLKGHRSGRLAGEATYFLERGEHRLQLGTESLPLAEIAEALKPLFPHLPELSSGSAKLNLSLISDKSLGRLAWGRIDSEGLDLRSEAVDYTGDLALSGFFLFGKEIHWSAKADVRGERLRVPNCPRPFRGVSGTVTIAKNRLFTDDLKALYAGSPVTAEGDLQTQAPRRLYLNILTETTPQTLADFVPEPADTLLRGENVRGEVEVRLNLDTNLEEGRGKLSGELRLLDAFFLGNPVEVKGTLGWGEETGLDLRFSAEDTLLILQLLLEENSVEVKNLKGDFGNSTLQMTGRVENLETPSFALDAGGKFAISDLAGRLPGEWPMRGWLESLPEESHVAFQGSLSGPLGVPGEWEGAFHLNCPRLTTAVTRLYNLEGDLLVDKGLIRFERLSTRLQKGSFTASGDIDTRGEKTRFGVNARANSLPFLLTSREEENGKEELYGIMDGELAMEGVAGEASTFEGSGRLKISKGKIWEIRFFQGLLDILSGYRPNVGKVVFDRIEGSFRIADNRLESADTVLSSRSLTIRSRGSLGFDDTVNARLSVRLFNLGESLLGRAASRVLNLPGKLVGIRLEGTLEKPIWKAEVLPFLSETKKMIREPLKIGQSSKEKAGQ